MDGKRLCAVHPSREDEPMSHDGLEPSIESWLVSAGRPDEPGAPLNAPIVPASSFLHGAGIAYSRDHGTPTWAALEELVGGLEKGFAVSFSSGMAAAAAVFELVEAGSLVVIPEDCYRGVKQLAGIREQRGRLRVRQLPAEDTEAWVEAASTADLIWLESTSNPLLLVADVAPICAAERKPGSILAVDNTFATPLNLQPLLLGADIAMHSATKYIGGHSDLLAGVAVAAREELGDCLRRTRELTGATPGALESFLAVRGARTMALRLERSQANAQELAERLERHPAVERVRYPGLPSHPTHSIAACSLGGFGAVISFDVAGTATRADATCRRARMIRHATSLGGVESTMERRAAMPGNEHLPASLIRLSVGIEAVEDLWADLDQALSTAG